MLASRGWKEETANEIIEEFEQLLCDNDIKINNINPKKINLKVNIHTLMKKIMKF